MIKVQRAHQLTDHLNLSVECPLRRIVDRSTLGAFVHISQDKSDIHTIDNATPVLPANLLLSLLPSMLQSGLVVKQFSTCKTVSFRDFRFEQSVTVDQPLVLYFEVLKVRRLKQNCFVSSSLTLKLLETKSAILTGKQTDCYKD